MKGGYVGKILLVDLSNERLSDEDLLDIFPETVLRKYVGCFGLGMKILYQRFRIGTRATDPENPLIFMTGPLTGLPLVPAATNTTIATLNADTKFTAGRSHSHGFWGPYLKFAGYDGIVVNGASGKPVYLWIADGRAEIRDATKFWGKDVDTHETENLIREDTGAQRASVAAIGPAGENVAAGALIANDKNHSFSHSGVGAVMGSKKLKAIAVYGTRKVPIADIEKLRHVTVKWKQNLSKSEVTQGESNAGAGKGNCVYEKEHSIASGKNFLEVSPPEWGTGMSSNEFELRPCFGCPIACSYDVKITSGPFKGVVATMNGGGENLEGAASISGVYDMGAAFYLTDLCDRLGFESSTIGCTIALAIESYERGLLTKEETGGIKLTWGDAGLVEKLLRMASRKEGKIGQLLALGPKGAAERIGGEAPKFAIHVKGAGMNLHDWRAVWGVMLGQIVGGGSSWPAPGASVYAPEPDVGFEKFVDPFDPKAQPPAVAKTWPKKYWDDCHGTCWFSTWGVPGSISFTAEAVSAVTGWDFTAEEARMVGERMVHLERAFNVRLGLTPAHDYEVSARIVESPSSGKGKGKPMAPHVRTMVTEVYRLMGWDEKTGKPLRSTLEKVGLEEIAQDLWS